MSTPATTADANGQQTAAAPQPGGRIPTEKIKLVMHQGLMLPHVFDSVETQVHNVKVMELRDSDVLLCSYPKSGTHWLWRILDMLLQGSAEYSSNIMDTGMLDLQPIDLVSQAPSPRILFTHYPFDLLPDQVKDGRVKVVHVYRHPKAVLTSLQFILRSEIMPDLTLDQLEQMLHAGKAAYGNMFMYFDKLAQYEKEHPNVNIYNVAYEDLKKDTAGGVQKLADYLGVKVTPELCRQIAEAVSFSNQKKQEEELNNESGRQKAFYRKGEASDWKNHLTVAQSERMDQVIRDRADTCRFSRSYLPSD